MTFDGDHRVMYRANYELRTALRILKPIASFKAAHENDLYRAIKAIPWEKYMNVDDTFAINTVVHSETFTHSKYVALKSKDAIADYFRDKLHRRPNVKLVEPTLRLHIKVSGKQFDVSLDSSCESLHKRGYRLENHLAPINEVLAAGMIMMTGWRGETTFIDPMCGSGTLLAEAALIARRIPPQQHRTHFGFKQWPDFDAALWEEVVRKADAQALPQAPQPILGFDVAFQAVRTTQRNLDRAGLAQSVAVKRKDFEKHNPPVVEKGIVVVNPPYGERIEADYEINAFYAMIGDHLKEAYTGYDVWIISSNMEALKCIGLHPTHKNTLFNGPLECKYQCYSIYEGSKKVKDEATEA